VKSRKRGVERIYLEALAMGLCIGVAAMLLDYWLNDSGWRTRIAALIVVGSGLCLLQYGITRFRRGG
jgi:hypothetical protein